MDLLQEEIVAIHRASVAVWITALRTAQRDRRLLPPGNFLDEILTQEFQLPLVQLLKANGEYNTARINHEFPHTTNWITDDEIQNLWIRKQLKLDTNIPILPKKMPKINSHWETMGIKNEITERDITIGLLDTTPVFGDSRINLLRLASGAWNSTLDSFNSLNWIKKIDSHTKILYIMKSIKNAHIKILPNTMQPTIRTVDDLKRYIITLQLSPKFTQEAIQKAKNNYNKSLRRQERARSGAGQINIELPKETLTGLDSLCKEYGIPRNKIIEILVARECSNKQQPDLLEYAQTHRIMLTYKKPTDNSLLADTPHIENISHEFSGFEADAPQEQTPEKVAAFLLNTL